MEQMVNQLAIAILKDFIEKLKSSERKNYLL